jgi:transcriptional regulator GlxA family with amidase domain
MTLQRAQRYRYIAEHFEEVARANIGDYVLVADLARIAGINQRTLSRAFREVRSVSPYRYLLCLRLSEVRRVLAYEGGTVTQAAMRFGFRELGKFGVLYRRAFDESPSETRQRGRSEHAISHREAPHGPGPAKETSP